jgi:CelD/BcsL family acetyltransferase involved in cellulose biosynthesis
MLDLRFMRDPWQAQAIADDVACYTSDTHLLQTDTNPYLLLPANIQEYEQGIKKQLRQTIRACHNRIKRDFPDITPALHMLSGCELGQDVMMELERFFALHAEYWRHRGVKTPLMCYPALKGFYRRGFQCDDSQQQMILTRLTLGQDTLSTMLAFWSGNRLMTHMLHYNSAYRRYNPGTLHFDTLARYLVTHCGGGVLDFGRGDDMYKSRWTTSCLPLWTVRAWRTPWADCCKWVDRMVKPMAHSIWGH